MFKIKFILSKLKSKKKEEKESFSLKDSDNREYMLLSRPELLKKIEEGLKKKELGETEKKQLVVKRNLKDKESSRKRRQEESRNNSSGCKITLLLHHRHLKRKNIGGKRYFDSLRTLEKINMK